MNSKYTTTTIYIYLKCPIKVNHFTWLLLGYDLAMTWLLLGYYSAITRLLPGYDLAITWL